MGLSLSVLDLIPRAEGTSSSQALRQSLEIARLVDRLGYTRLWYAEHHNMANIASTTPSIMIALAAEATERIRVGSGGVMLPNHAALQVAEAFRMLEALAPGRIDLGLGRAPGTDGTTAMALRGSVSAVEQDLFPAKLAELMAFGRNSFPDRHPYKSVSAQPDDVPLPPLWLLGSSAYSAHLAASLGVGYGFAAHFSDLPPEGPMRAYRDEFESQGTLAEPHALLTLSVIVADTQAEVDRQTAAFMVNIAQALTSQRVRLLTPEEAENYAFSPRERAIAESFKAKLIAGTPAVVKARIEELVARTGADEVMVSTMVYDFAARKRSLELLAEAFGLAAAVAPAGRGA